jgi:hypothetical protein
MWEPVGICLWLLPQTLFRSVLGGLGSLTRSLRGRSTRAKRGGTEGVNFYRLILDTPLIGGDSIPGIPIYPPGRMEVVPSPT